MLKLFEVNFSSTTRYIVRVNKQAPVADHIKVACILKLYSKSLKKEENFVLFEIKV